MSKINIYANFELALNKLREYLSSPILEERDKSGVIQAFEFTFETAWKTLQKILVNEGFEPRGPKHCLELAIQQGFIKHDKEETWKKILSDRNLTVHTYRQQTAESVFQNISNYYVSAFGELLEFIKVTYE